MKSWQLGNRLLFDVSPTWGDIWAQEPIAQLGRWAVVTDDALAPYRALVLALRDGIDVCVVPRSRITSEVERALATTGYRLVDDRPPAAGSTAPRGTLRSGGVGVLSSGTTGVPSVVEHDTSSLATNTRAEAGCARTWLVPFLPGTYAWFQSALLSLSVRGQDLAPYPPGTGGPWLDVAVSHEVNAISSTPTFWRRSLMEHSDDELRRVPFRQISLGGEPVDQAILNQLRSLYPETRLTHIYASSEVGAAIVVHDGQAGFPAAWLDRSRAGRPNLCCREGRLWVESPFAAPALQRSWVDTGDSVRIEGDRAYVVGRASELFINVGGSKVDATHVETVLTSYPGVRFARVRGRSAPIVGEMVVAYVVAETDVTERSLKQWCSERLATPAVPRRLTFLREIPMADSGKATSR